MNVKPFLKWAGGKRWLVEREIFASIVIEGTYIEPFLGGGAVFFHLKPTQSLLSDVNPRLIETYNAIITEWPWLIDRLQKYHFDHNVEHYYLERKRVHLSPRERAAQFLYLNRTCWNGLYRVNLKGEFNVPIGTKKKVIDESEDFESIAKLLSTAQISCCDFEDSIDKAAYGDLIFVDPPYTTAHNFNGFVKYNEDIFTWDDQKRLASSLRRARKRGASIISTNADHESVRSLYRDDFSLESVSRNTVISGISNGRGKTSELLICDIEIMGGL